MQIKWTEKAHSDLKRLYDFLAPANRQAAAKSVQAIVAAPVQLLRHPRLGEKLEEFEPRDVRRILIGAYEMRYEIADETIYILRIWHGREDR
ncbi:type II toxin-antitoxin system RelE/ParE family toxin [Neorhizobium sp. P12A]|jgi:plasmid stabilization system protein ParE|uniref:type II toxin-antitoxin system RelE/ParE family toxin n=1 Tax=Neorhizobium sp. P12A TaxID=2268027 RepID=UPI0011F02A19|nr:type II toxin-antitoxin system RelE/ParE family toxin [Neorhizobium sp. P12A]KAA0700497.1 type II toxin-antitoxin system RelE/ParE family toxin [Neorhizobium sp. P12A]